jgi:hypothetical protein
MIDLSELPFASFNALLEAGATKSSFDAMIFKNECLILLDLLHYFRLSPFHFL